MKKMFVAALGASMLLAPAAFAKGGKATPQNHHCMKDGAELAGVTKKECKKQGGKWEKMAAAPAGGDAAGGAGATTPPANP